MASLSWGVTWMMPDANMLPPPPAPVPSSRDPACPVETALAGVPPPPPA